MVLVLDFDARESEVVENKVQWCANQSTVVVEGNWTKRKLMSHHDSPFLQNQIPRHNAPEKLNLFLDIYFRFTKEFEHQRFDPLPAIASD